MTNARVMVAAISLLGGLLVATTPGHAQNPDAQAAGALKACGAIARKSARLACYDRLARGIPDAPAAEASPAPAQQAAPAAASFGSETIHKKQRPRAERRTEDQITAEVASAKDNGIGHWLITLSDGAQWQMTEMVGTFIPPRQGDMITIRRGALGGYLMDVNHQASVRVRRLH